MTDATFAMMEDLPDRIEELVVSQDYHTMQASGVMICVLVVANGTAFIGHSVTGDMLPMEHSMAVAREMAKNKIVDFESYLVAQRLHEGHPAVDWAKKSEYRAGDLSEGTDF